MVSAHHRRRRRASGFESGRRRDLIRELQDVYAAESAPEGGRTRDHGPSELQFRKWRLIHKYVHDTPFPTNGALPRSEQWRDVVDHVREIGEIELLDWVLQQVEIATHLEHGIQDLRPRKNGPCHGLVLEYVSNRKRKAFAVYRWVLASSGRTPAGADDPAALSDRAADPGTDSAADPDFPDRRGGR